jgi:hypothetical protein
MNVLDAQCPKCDKPFRWLSGTPLRCNKCVETEAVEEEKQAINSKSAALVVVFTDGLYLDAELLEVKVP